MNPEYNREYHKRYYWKHHEKEKERMKLYMREYTKIHPNRTLTKAREELVQSLGGWHCSCIGVNCWHSGLCQVNDKRVLQIEHRGGGGAKDLKEKGGPLKLYQYYLINSLEAVRKLQIFCANCNWAKRVRNGEVRKRIISKKRPKISRAVRTAMNIINPNGYILPSSMEIN